MASRSLLTIVSIVLLVSSMIEVDANAFYRSLRSAQDSNRILGVGHAESSYYSYKSKKEKSVGKGYKSEKSDGKGYKSEKSDGKGYKYEKSDGKGYKSDKKGSKSYGKDAVQYRYESNDIPTQPDIPSPTISPISLPTPSPVQDVRIPATEEKPAIWYSSSSDDGSGQATNTETSGESTSESTQGRVDKLTEDESNGSANDNSQFVIGINEGESSVPAENNVDGELTDSTGTVQVEQDFSEEFQNVFGNEGSNGGRPFVGVENGNNGEESFTGAEGSNGESGNAESPSQGNINIGGTPDNVNIGEGNNSNESGQGVTGGNTSNDNGFLNIGIGSSEGVESNEQTEAVNIGNGGTAGSQSSEGSLGINLDGSGFSNGTGGSSSGSQGSNGSASFGGNQGTVSNALFTDGSVGSSSGSQGSNGSASSGGSQGTASNAQFTDGSVGSSSGSQGSNGSGSSGGSQGTASNAQFTDGPGGSTLGSQGSNGSASSEGTLGSVSNAQFTDGPGGSNSGSQGSNDFASSGGSQGSVSNTLSTNGSSEGSSEGSGGTISEDNQGTSSSVGMPDAESFEFGGPDWSGTQNNENAGSESNENGIENNQEGTNGDISIVNSEGVSTEGVSNGTGDTVTVNNENGTQNKQESSNSEGETGDSTGAGTSLEGSSGQADSTNSTSRDQFTSDISTAVFCPEMSSDKEILINWIYAVEFLPDLTNEEKAQAVAIMELKLVSELLQCTPTALPGKRYLFENGVAGLNYMPLDAKNDDVVCFFSNSTDGGVCETYFGRMEMYLQQDSDENIAINNLLISIRDIMQRNDFPAVDGIVQVWYLEPELSDIVGISDGGAIINDPKQPVDSFSTGTMIAFAALGVFVFAALVLGAFRMRRNETNITVFDSTIMGSGMTDRNDSATLSAILPNSYKLEKACGMDAIPEGDDDAESRYNGSIILSDGGYTSDGSSHKNDPLYPTHFDPVLGDNQLDADDMGADNDLLFENTQNLDEIKCMGERSFSYHRKTNLVKASQVGLGRMHSTVDVHKCNSSRCTICKYKPKDVEFIHKSPNSPAVSAGRFFPEDEYHGDEII